MTRNMTSEWVLYLRKSKGRAGIGRQRTTTTAHIERLGGRIVAEFRDTDRTAFRIDGGEQPKRDGFGAMLAMLAARPGLGVAAWHADRLTRNEQDTAALGRACRVIETKSGGSYDLATANGRKRFRDDASDAQYEVDHNRERVIEKKLEAAADGQWLGGRRPFGWQIIKSKPKQGIPPRLILDEREAAALRQAYRDVLDRRTLYAIARGWNDAGLSTTTGRPWKPGEVRRVLQRPMNAAPPPAKWPAIVDADTHRTVVALLADPARRQTPGPERTHLLSGLALCATCGKGLICSTVGAGRGRQRAVYRCRASVEGEAGHVARDAVALDEYITAVVIERLSRRDAKKLLLRQSQSELPRLQRERIALADAMKASNDLRRRKLLTDLEFAEERAEHQEKMLRLDAAIAAAEQADVLAPMIRDPEAVWASRDLSQRRAIVAALMTVTVQPQAKGRPKGWKPGQPYFDPDSVQVTWKR